MSKIIVDFETAQKYLCDLASNSLKFDNSQDLIQKQTNFLKSIGNPHLDLKLIHIAGTSGKGSTTTILANILASQGFRVGSSISPHVTNICERIQLNNKPISQDKFTHYFNQILPAFETASSQNNPPSYFELLTAMQFLVFANEKVDYAIMEVGMGGRLDATNVFVPNKICIINSIGLDHTEVLGDTIELIANEKAGIIQSQNQVIAISQDLKINKIFTEKANDEKADLDFVIPEFCFDNVKLYDDKTYFSYIDQDILDRQIVLGVLGKYQAANASLALRATEVIAFRDNWNIDWEALKSRLIDTKLTGRFEIQNILDKKTILDGAHNPQKMQAFIQNLIQYYPDRKFDFLVSFKKGKDTQAMLDIILSIQDKINSITITSFTGNQDIQFQSQELATISDYLEKCKYKNFIAQPDLKTAYSKIQSNPNTISVITGSLYLISAIKQLQNPI